MATQTVLDLPAITYVQAGDVAYLVRGTGALRDKQINVEDGLIPVILTYTAGDSINLASYGGDVTVYASNSITLTFSGTLRDGKQLVVMNKGAGTITCAGTVTASLRVDESLHGVSDSSIMAVTRYVTNDASGNLLAYGNIVGSGTASIDGVIKSGTTGTNGSMQIARTSDGATLGTFTTDGTDVTLGSSSGVLSLQTASTDRIVIDASGNVGIGITPTELLHVSKSQNATTEVLVTNANAGTSAGAGFKCIAETALGFFEAYSDGYTANSWGDVVVAGSGSGATNGLVLYSAVERMRFQGAVGATRMELNNNVLAMGGITPKAWSSGYRAMELGGTGMLMSFATRTAGGDLHIGQNIYFDGSWKRMTTDEVSRYVQATGTHQWFTDASGTADAIFTPTERMRLNAAGQLLIGTDAAASDTNIKQTVYSPGVASYTSYQTAATGTGTANGCLVGQSDASGLLLWNRESTGIAFGTSNTERMTLSAAGDLAINSTKFTVDYATGNTKVGGSLIVAGATDLLAVETRALTVNDGYDLNVGTGDLIVNINKFEVTGATGNTFIAGTLDVIGNTTLRTLDARDTTVLNGYDLTVVGGTTTLNGTTQLNGTTDLNATSASTAMTIDNVGTGPGLDIAVASSTGGGFPFIATSGVVTLCQMFASGEVYLPTTYGKTSASAANVYIDSVGQLFRSTSSRKYKEKERELEMDTSKVFDIEVVTFDMKDSEEIGHGPIAEDAAEVEVNFATYDRDGDPEAIHTNNVLYALLEEVKKLKADREDDSTAIAMLQYELDQLKGGA